MGLLLQPEPGSGDAHGSCPLRCYDLTEAVRAGTERWSQGNESATTVPRGAMGKCEIDQRSTVR